MKFYTRFVSKDKSEAILRPRYENGVHRVCVPGKKSKYLLETLAGCEAREEPEDLLTSPTVLLQLGNINVTTDIFP
jgi:hypothetical protein